MDWTAWLNTITNTLEVPMPPDNPVVGAGPSGDANFNLVYPQAITYTELRLQRDLDLIGAQVTDTTGTLSANTRILTLPMAKGNFIVTTQIKPIVGGQQQAPLLPVSRPFLEMVWPSNAGSAVVPQFWCPVDQVSVLVAPAVTATLNMAVTGNQRFTELSPSNMTNFLTLYVPDLYIALSLVWLAGWQRDYGMSSEDPQKAISWEGVYMKLLASASVEEVRKKFESVGWSPRLPSPIATPAKT